MHYTMYPAKSTILFDVLHIKQWELYLTKKYSRAITV